MAGYNILEYLKGLQGQTFPPLLVEVLLKSGRSFYVKNAFPPNPELEMVVLRVWDLRAVDTDDLREKLNAVTDREAWEEFAEIDPAVDQANLWVHMGEIEGFVEWHERYWSVAEREKGPEHIGFFHEPDK